MSHDECYRIREAEGKPCDHSKTQLYIDGVLTCLECKEPVLDTHPAAEEAMENNAEELSDAEVSDYVDEHFDELVHSDKPQPIKVAPRGSGARFLPKEEPQAERETWLNTCRRIKKTRIKEEVLDSIPYDMLEKAYWDYDRRRATESARGAFKHAVYEFMGELILQRRIQLEKGGA